MSNTDILKCGECGVDFESGAKFCSSCGSPAPAPQPRFCTSCGKNLQAGDRFCTSCGTPVTTFPQTAVIPAATTTSASLLEQMKQFCNSLNAQLTEKKGLWTLTTVVAERKAFLSTKKLEYIAKFRIDDAAREIKFTEMLKESGSGLSTGGDMGDISPGFGFKSGSYKVGMDGREGSIEEQSNLFGRQYQYKFDFKAIRTQVENMAKGAGYNYKYQITSIGL